ncbi:MAG: NAD-glutamate dehydrogenase, partial [Brevundimonas sp.]
MTVPDLRQSSVQPITKAALEAAFARIVGTGPGAAEQAYLAQAHEDYAADETPELGGEDLAALLAASWKAAQDYPQDASAPVITVGPLAGADGKTLDYDLIRIVQSDAPFLVDSVMGVLADAGVSVRALFHPIGDVGGRRLSIIILVIDSVPQERRDALGEGVAQSLADVHAAVGDHEAMNALMRQAVQRLEATPPRVDPAVLAENIAFLKWLKSDHFVFLGARDYDYPLNADGDYEAEAPLSQSSAGLGILADPDRTVLRRASEPAVLTRQMRRQLDLSEPVTVAKANARSRVHRRAYMDYIGVKRYGAEGKATGETRFVGLFTSEAYDQLASDVPLVRRKVANALARADKAPGSHNEKRLKNILENYPRDELFQIGEDELLSIALGVLHLYDRPRIRIFTRQDPFDRFVSVLLFVPRERYDVSVRERIGHILARAWGGRISAWYPQLTDAPLTRVHFIIGVEPGGHPTPDLAQLEADVAEAGRGWMERFESALRRADIDDVEVGPLSARWARAFGAAYRDRYDADEAVRDLQEIDRLSGDGLVGPGALKKGEPVAVRAFRDPNDSPLQFRFKLYRRGPAVPLSDVLPIMADMGLKTLEEYGYPIRPAGDGEIHVHEFLMEDPRGEALVFADVKAPFERAFAAVWTGRTESDGFNRLVIELGVEWREAALIRTLAHYRQQTGLDPSQTVQEEALREY